MDDTKEEGHRQTGFETFNFLISNTVKNMEKLKTKGMGDYGLSATHTLCIRHMYDSPDGLTRTELSRLCSVDRAQITRIIGELLAKGYVEEIGSGSNYRKKCVLTDKGRDIARDIDERLDRVIQFVSGSIPRDRLEIFYQTLSEICNNLENAEKYLKK